MCGIIGAFCGGKELGGIPVSATDLDRLKHRGPDGQGWFVDPHAVMGFRRLAIIDLAGGWQPLYSEDEQVVLTVNGEIYNHHELRRSLEKHHRFRTHVDAEVLLHLYEDHGIDFLAKVEGMFGFALYDRRKRRVILGRDRAGKKPLYYENRDGVLRWASELNALVGERRPPVNREALDDYLRFGYVPAPFTMIEGISKLPAATILIADAEGRQHMKRYWLLRFLRDNWSEPTPAEERGWSHDLEMHLDRAVQRRLESEVPLGFLLSGGIDSCAVFACGAAAIPEGNIRAFTIGHGDSTIDESTPAGLVATRYRAEHTISYVHQSSADALDEVLRLMGEPVSTDALLPTNEVFAGVANARITTVLSGEGADEILAGYRKFRHASPWGQKTINEEISPLQRYLAHEEFVFADDRERRLLTGVSGMANRFAELEREAEELDPLSQMLLIETRLRLPDRINLRLDRLSMAHSIEARAPFMDQALMEFCACIPKRLLIGKDSEKVILRQAMRNRLPQVILNARKAPFKVPDRWYTQSSSMDTVLSNAAVTDAGLVNAHEVSVLRTRVEQTPHDTMLHEKLYSLYVLHLWHSSFYGNAQQKEALS